MKTYTAEELKTILASHALWLRGDSKEVCADLRSADLQGANLRGTNLEDAHLEDAHLEGANLQCANLQDAHLQGANLQGANLQDAHLEGANLQGATLPHYKMVPQEGEFIAYKKVASGAILRLLIPEYAARTNSLVGRKCRASHAIVLSASKPGPLVSKHDSNFVYEVGKEVSVSNFDPDIRVECTSGIHFFISEEEAREY